MPENQAVFFDGRIDVEIKYNCTGDMWRGIR